MAGTANISSSFVITYNPSSTADSIISTSRAFKVVGVQAINTTAGGLTVAVDKNNGDDVVDGSPTVSANSAEWLELVEANTDVAANQTLSIDPSGTGVLVRILCVASGGGQALTVTDE